MFFRLVFGSFDQNDLNNVFEGVDFSKEFKYTPYRYILRIFTPVVETGASSNWNYCGQNLAGLFTFQEVRYMVLKKK